MTATPEPGQGFLNWSTDASGAQNPLSISMAQSKTVTANFTSHAALRTDRPGLEGLTPEGFRLTLTSPQTAWQILGSTDLSQWETLGTVTNNLGEVQFIDPGAGTNTRRFYKAVPPP